MVDRFVSRFLAMLMMMVTFPCFSYYPKHLAGPPEEMDMVGYVDRKDTVVYSKSALIPLQLGRNAEGELTTDIELDIDAKEVQVMLFSGAQPSWSMGIKAPGETRYKTADRVATDVSEVDFGMGNEKYPATHFQFSDITAGRWSTRIYGNEGSERGYALVSSDSPYYLQTRRYQGGETVGEKVSFVFHASIDSDVFRVVNKDIGLIQAAHMHITEPNGERFSVSGYDDGKGVDQQALDGVFYAEFIARYSGEYQVQVEVSGQTPEGLPFHRTTEHVVAVVEADVELISKQATGSSLDENRMGISIRLDAPEHKTYRVMGEIWGSDSPDGKQTNKPVNWVSTMATIKNGVLSLESDNRWIMSADVYPPYEIRNLRLQDSYYFLNVLSVDRLSLQLPEISDRQRSAYKGEVTQDMLMGKKPQELINRFQRNFGKKLMLVHGYCSDGSWTDSQYHFADAAVFWDLNQNRSHDEYARLLDTYGDNFESFGIVAHSQGGAAALHLYTYYWSGLDNAGAGRLLQSVGTPYKGSPLAGVIAALGEVFGVRCGYNYNLTVIGANSWLSGIPTWARNKVNYYSTSFKDSWWRPDWCKLASDPILIDPDDGVVEKFRAQLAGGINRGHTEGQCHTKNMRDPAQTLDFNRNNIMSIYGAR